MPTVNRSPEQSHQGRLRNAVAAFTGQPFALVDGGLFDDLPAIFKRKRLFARSLFLDSADAEVQAAGPWLVKLDQAPDAAVKVFAIVGDKPAAVFWSCAAGEMVLYRHLRSLNIVRLPRWAIIGATASSTDQSDLQSYDTAMFRHWDPRVLGVVIPCLEPSQFSRVLGPTEEIAFISYANRFRRVIKNVGWPAASSGQLTLQSYQLESVSLNRAAVGRNNILAFLRKSAPNETSIYDDAALHEKIEQSEIIGRSLGIESERALGCYLFLLLKNQWLASERLDRRIAESSNQDFMAVYLLSEYEHGIDNG